MYLRGIRSGVDLKTGIKKAMCLEEIGLCAESMLMPLPHLTLAKPKSESLKLSFRTIDII